ncbi:MAG: mechanosensitive ion channel, partial [Chromatiales bacterium]
TRSLIMQRLLRALLLVLFLPFCQQLFAADEVSILNAEKEIQKAAETIKNWDKETTPLEETERLRTRLFELQALANECVSSLENDVQINKTKIEALGEKGEDEASELKAQRKTLEEEAKQLNQRVAICRLALVGAEEQLDKIASFRQDKISQQLTSRTIPAWTALKSFPADFKRQLASLVEDTGWFHAGWFWGMLLSLIALLPAGVVVGRLLKDIEQRNIGDARLKVRARLAGMYGRRLPWVMLFVAIGTTQALVGNAYGAYSFVMAIALLTSPLIDYALCNERERCPASVPLRILWTLSLFSLVMMLVPYAFPDSENTIVIAFRSLLGLFFLITAIWLVFSLSTYPELARFGGVRWPLIPLFMTGPLAYILGYQNFGIFFSRGMFGTLMVAILGWLFYRTLVIALRPPSMSKGGADTTDAEFDRFSLRRVVILVIVSLSSFLLALRLWQLTPRDTAGLTYRLSQPFEIGDISLVPSKLFLGLVIFLLFWMIARLLQRTATNLLVTRDPASRGARQSFITLLAYVLITTGFLVSLSAAGLDLSNIAIIAGALSVGIGFGLQNIVSNFISGIILLFERPIRPGDWIRVGTTEGYVRNVRIRSTIIETFDRAEVLVPNSDLLSNQVVNLTLTDGIGRIIIPVGVAYGSNTKKVREIILRVAKDHPQVIQNESGIVPPRVLFRDFADSSLLFELRCFIKNVDYRLVVESDLRYAIDDAFRDEHIEIPFPQRVVYMHQASIDPAKAT